MQVERRSAVFCRRFPGYSRIRLYRIAELKEHIVVIVNCFEDLYDLYMAAGDNLVFLKMHKLDMYLSMETPTEFVLVG